MNFNFSWRHVKTKNTGLFVTNKTVWGDAQTPKPAVSEPREIREESVICVWFGTSIQSLLATLFRLF